MIVVQYNKEENSFCRTVFRYLSFDMNSSFLLKFVCLINEVLFGGSGYFGKAMARLDWEAAEAV